MPITSPGTRAGARPVTVIRTLDGVLPAADAAGRSRNPGAAARAKLSAARGPAPGGALYVLAAFAPARAAARAVRLARYQAAAWTITISPARKTGTMMT
ncbi:MAG: hypothetical protein ACYCPF_00805 [Streptosporangiaceae bacterium]